MTGILPSTSGVYHNSQPWRPAMPKAVTLPQHFTQHGYWSAGSGKIYHGRYPDPASWQTYFPDQKKNKPVDPLPAKRPVNGIPKTAHFDWGPVAKPSKAMGDYQVADWIIGQLKREHEKPFFLGCGIYLPHLPWYVPGKYFDMHPLENIQLPEHRTDDFDDIPEGGKRMASRAGGIIRESGKWREAVQGCLAAASFADACVGHVLNALKESPYAENTIIVLWGDHGYDVGEKKFAKSALWEQTTRTPLIIHVPAALGGNKNVSTCTRPVSLLDLYPTLIDLCGFPPSQTSSQLDGRSIAALVRNPQAKWPYPAIITHSPHWHGPNHAVRSERFHYIHYNKGGEELYDVAKDPNQWHNLATDDNYSKDKAELKKWLPKKNAPHFRPTKP